LAPIQSGRCAPPDNRSLFNSKAWIEPLAHVLKNLGCERAWITHGEGGFDEIVPSGAPWVAELKDGKIATLEIAPEDIGLSRSKSIGQHPRDLTRPGARDEANVARGEPRQRGPAGSRL
jgi:anthranilate phosphoribosyltransferase